MFGQFREKQLQILIGIEAVGLCCFSDTVKHGTGSGTIICFYKNKVLTPDGEWTDCLLSVVVVGRDVAVSQEYTKIFFRVDAVGKSLADCTVMSYLTILVFYPREISVNLFWSFARCWISGLKNGQSIRLNITDVVSVWQTKKVSPY